MGWLYLAGVLLLFLILALLPAGVQLHYDSEKEKDPLTIRVSYICSFGVYPKKEKPQKAKKQKKAGNKKVASSKGADAALQDDKAADLKKQKFEKAGKTKKEKETFADNLRAAAAVLRGVSGVAGKLLRRVTLSCGRLQAEFCEGDPADTAIAYGRLMAIANGLSAMACNLLKIKWANVQINPDLEGEQEYFKWQAEVKLRMPLWAVLAYGLKGGFGALKEIIKAS